MTNLDQYAAVILSIASLGSVLVGCLVVGLCRGAGCERPHKGQR